MNTIQMTAKFFNEGGIFMYVILMVMAFAVAIALERYYYFNMRCKLNAKKLLTEIKKMLESGNIGTARKLCVRSKSPLAIILESGIWHYEQGDSIEEIQNGIDETALREIPRIQHRTHYLSLFSNVATLLGLLGTIQGLMTTFSALGGADATQKSTLLAIGIAQAMNTTAFGLVVAIPCMIAFSTLSSKANRLIEEVDESSVRLLNYLFNLKKKTKEPKK